jgi:uncharacterized DUF497 family protein
MLKFEWDENKNIVNKEKHKISFETAQYVFLDPAAPRAFDRTINGEDRWHIIGKILGVIVVLVVYTERNGNTRIISARKANKKERILYHGNQQKDA